MTSWLYTLRRVLIFTFGYFLLIGAVPVYGISQLDQIIGSIEGNLLNWVELNAKIQLQFVNSYDQGAGCTGQLTYHRLNEKIHLQCFNDANNLVFSFKTNDHDFEMYIPSKKTLFKGNIFGLEASQLIDSHVQPLHLYRALKTFSIPKQFTEIESWEKNRIELKVFGVYGENDYLARRLVSSPQGEVSLEIFYDHNQAPVTTVHRSEFKTFRSSQKTPLRNKIRFPQHIKIEAPNDGDSRMNETNIYFDHIEFSQTSSPTKIKLNIPPETRIINIR